VAGQAADVQAERARQARRYATPSADAAIVADAGAQGLLGKIQVGSILGDSGVSGVINRLPLHLRPWGAKILAELAVTGAGQYSLGASQQLGSNAITRALVDPRRPLGTGVADAGLANAIVGTVLHAGARTAPFVGDSESQAPLAGLIVQARALQRLRTKPTEQLGADGAVVPQGDARSSALHRESTGNHYSVAFETTLDPGLWGRVVGVHNHRAQAALDAMFTSHPEFAVQMERVIPGIRDAVSRMGGRTTPDDWTWHHEAEPGVMQLVPRDQHTVGSKFWKTLHPNGRGGYAIWARPAGAPKR